VVDGKGSPWIKYPGSDWVSPVGWDGPRLLGMRRIRGSGVGSDWVSPVGLTWPITGGIR
jgi:hypothetical protein